MFKKFYKDIKNTFYNKDFYNKIEKIGLSHPFWLIVKLSLLSSIVFVLLLIPSAITFVKDANEFSSNNYFPSELEIKIEDGIATTNLSKEPYYINSDVFQEKYRPKDAENLILINTKEDLTLEQVSKEEVFLIVSRSSFLIKTEDDTRVFHYANILNEELVINKDITESFVKSIVSKLPIVLTFLFIFGIVFLTLSGIFMWHFMALLLSPIAMVVNKTRRIGLKYNNVYKLSMYALIPAIVVDILTDILVGPTSFSFILTVAIFTIVLVWNTEPKNKLMGTPPD